MGMQSYRDLQQQLSEVLAWFDSDDVDINEAVSKYEEGTKLIAALEKQLKLAENKITKVKISE